MRYTIEDLKIIGYIGKFKSFSKAAEKMDMKAPNITAKVNGLEERLGYPLFYRTTREVGLTNEGKIIYNLCGKMFKTAEEFDLLLNKTKEVSGTLKIAIPPYFSRNHIVPYFQEFLSKFPKLNLEIICTENPIDLIAEGVDLQVRIQSPEDEDLQVADLMDNEKVVCASPKYLKENGYVAHPRELLNHNCLIFGENKKWEFRKRNDGTIESLSDIRGNIVCDNGELIKELVLAGIGITLKSKKDIEEELESGKLVALLVDYEVINKTKFYIVYPSSKITSPKTKAFIDFYQSKLRNH